MICTGNSYTIMQCEGDKEKEGGGLRTGGEREQRRGRGERQSEGDSNVTLSGLNSQALLDLPLVSVFH